MKIGIITEARMTSSRLPGKHMLKVGNKFIYEIFLDQLKKSKLVDTIVLATTINKPDDALCALARGLNVDLYRGSEENVLERVLGAALSFDIDIIVEITADCPLIDPGLIDLAIRTYLDSDVDYVSNVINRQFADGMDVQVFSSKLLRDNYSPNLASHHLEHVTTHLRGSDSITKLDLLAESTCFAPDASITLDTREDYKKICKIYKQLVSSGKSLNCKNITELLR